MNANAGLSLDERKRIKANLEQCIAVFEATKMPLDEAERALKARLIEAHAEVSRLGPGRSAPPRA